MPPIRPTKIVCTDSVCDLFDVQLEPIGQENRDPIPEELSGECGHDRRDVDFGDEHSVDIADQCAPGQGEDKADPGGPGRIIRGLENPGKDEAGKRNHGGEAQIDLSGGDDQGEAQSADEHGRHRLQEGHINPIP